MKDMDVTIDARSDRCVWLWPDFPDRLPDGSSAEDQIALGHVEALGFTPRYKKANRSRTLGDLLWTGGSATKIASIRLVEALTELAVTEFTTFRIEIDHPLIEPGDYMGLAVTGRRGADDLYQLHDYTPNSSMGIRPALLAALHERGVDWFEIGEFDRWYAVNREPLTQDEEDDLLDDYDDPVEDEDETD